jgi:5-(aminomethyl)-3-furanmethanol phosphate kinase
MWVVKLGGSLSRDSRLPHWLHMLAEFGGGRVTVVPGGAGFAEAVRDAQAHWGFDDVAAHNMAVLAMAQTAQMLHALERRLVMVTDEDGIRSTLHSGKPALWLPLSLLRDAPDQLTSWEVTSDSLALWLARRLNAERLVVVKACELDPGHTIADLGATGVLDVRFGHWASDAAFVIEVVQGDEIERVRDALLGGPRLGPPFIAPRPPRKGRKPAA